MPKITVHGGPTVRPTFGEMLAAARVEQQPDPVPAEPDTTVVTPAEQLPARRPESAAPRKRPGKTVRGRASAVLHGPVANG